MRRVVLFGSIFLAVTAVYLGITAESAAVSLPDPTVDADSASKTGLESAVLAGGCFWCTEAVLERLQGVEKVTSGYAGGDEKTAHYNLVSEGRTNHTESIEVVFDPAKISYGQILKVFFSVAHDPTQLNRQGPDWGRQYRSAIFWLNPEQERIAKAYVEQLTAAKAFGKPIVTELKPLDKFYPAEAYHQDFVKNNPAHPYVVVNALPKLRKLAKEFPDLVKK